MRSVSESAIRASKYLLALVVGICVVACASENQSASEGDKIIFFGDSITKLGSKPGGYVTLLRDSLHKTPEWRNFEFIASGVSGDQVPDLLERVDESVIARKPKVVVIYIGINDVWHFVTFLGRGTPKEEYKVGLRALVDKIAGAGAKVILCTPSVIGEKHDGTNALDGMLDEYAEITRITARSMNLQLCDLRKEFIEYLRRSNPENKEEGILTYDSVHLNDAGNRLVADEILKTLSRGE